jgi:hypothetical protein
MAMTAVCGSRLPRIPDLQMPRDGSERNWLFALSQVRRLDGLADVESAFQRDDLGPDVPSEASACWKASLAAKAAITLGCVETRIPRVPLEFPTGYQ